MAKTESDRPRLLIELQEGAIEVALWPGVAPGHVARIVALARDGAYDGIIFHRVIEGFMAQTGDVAHGHHEHGSPRLAGTGGSALPDLALEPSDRPHARGTLGMARARAPDSANSQFFINMADNHFLNGQYTVFGEVTAGMAHIDALARGEPPARPGRMTRVEVRDDA